MNKGELKLYYSFCTEREGSWQRSNGFVISDNKEKLQAKIDSLPKFDDYHSWEYDKIVCIEVSNSVYELFLTKSKNKIYFGDDFEIEKFI